jgi:hypothetical protein
MRGSLAQFAAGMGEVTQPSSRLEEIVPLVFRAGLYEPAPMYDCKKNIQRRCWRLHRCPELLFHHPTHFLPLGSSSFTRSVLFSPSSRGCRERHACLQARWCRRRGPHQRRAKEVFPQQTTLRSGRKLAAGHCIAIERNRPSKTRPSSGRTAPEQGSSDGRRLQSPAAAPHLSHGRDCPELCSSSALARRRSSASSAGVARSAPGSNACWWHGAPLSPPSLPAELNSSGLCMGERARLRVWSGWRRERWGGVASPVDVAAERHVPSDEANLRAAQHVVDVQRPRDLRARAGRSKSAPDRTSAACACTVARARLLTLLHSLSPVK